MELLTTLGIDWQVMLAQAINFGILIVALSYLLYKPVLRLLDDRRERIRKSMEDAKHIENQKRELDTLKQERIRTADREASAILEQAKGHAESMKKDIIAGAEREAHQILTKAKQQADDERGRVLSGAQETLAKVIIKMSEKIIEREFTSDDQKRILAHVQKDLPAILQ